MRETPDGPQPAENPLRLAHWSSLADRVASRPAIEADRMDHDAYDVARDVLNLRRRVVEEWAAFVAKARE